MTDVKGDILFVAGKSVWWRALWPMVLLHAVSHHGLILLESEWRFQDHLRWKRVICYVIIHKLNNTRWLHAYRSIIALLLYCIFCITVSTLFSLRLHFLNKRLQKSSTVNRPYRYRSKRPISRVAEGRDPGFCIIACSCDLCVYFVRKLKVKM